MYAYAVILDVIYILFFLNKSKIFMVITEKEVLSVSEEFQFTVILMIQNWMLFLLLLISRSVVLAFETWQT